MANELALQTTLSNSTALARNTEQKVYILMEAYPTGAAAAVNMPLNLCLILDRSRSMEGSKISAMRQAVKNILAQMTPQDIVSIVAFDDKLEVIASPQNLANVGNLQRAVDRISERGGTTISKGMRQGIDFIRQAASPDRVSRMILLTDGETFGDEDLCNQMAMECGQSNIPILAFGLGDDWNETFLYGIVSYSGGSAFYLDTPDSIVTNFQDTLQSMQRTVVTNAALTLRVVAGVTPVRAWKFRPQLALVDPRTLAERHVVAHLGDIERDTGQVVLVELKLAPKAAGPYRIAQADLSYDVPALGFSNEHARQDIILTLTDDPSRVSPQDAKVASMVARSQAFILQEEARLAKDAGNLGAVTQRLENITRILTSIGDVEAAKTVKLELDNLNKTRNLNDLKTKQLSQVTRKLDSL